MWCSQVRARLGFAAGAQQFRAAHAPLPASARPAWPAPPPTHPPLATLFVERTSFPRLSALPISHPAEEGLAPQHRSPPPSLPPSLLQCVLCLRRRWGLSREWHPNIQVVLWICCRPAGIRVVSGPLSPDAACCGRGRCPPAQQRETPPLKKKTFFSAEYSQLGARSLAFARRGAGGLWRHYEPGALGKVVEQGERLQAAAAAAATVACSPAQLCWALRSARPFARCCSAPSLPPATPEAFVANPSLVWEFYSWRREVRRREVLASVRKACLLPAPRASSAQPTAFLNLSNPAKRRWRRAAAPTRRTMPSQPWSASWRGRAGG